MFLFVLYLNFFPHLEIVGESQYILRNFRGVSVRMFDVFYLWGVLVKKHPVVCLAQNWRSIGELQVPATTQQQPEAGGGNC